MIYVFGTVCMDRVHRVPRLPKAGGYMEVLDEYELLGGEAANTAYALATWQNPVILAGNPLGNSYHSSVLNRILEIPNLQRLSLVAAGVEQSSLQTPVCDVYVTDDGDRTMFGKGFAALNHVVDLGHFPWSPGSWFTAEPNIEQVSRQAARLAHGSGMKIYLMDFFREDDPIFAGSIWQSSTDWVGTRGDVVGNIRWVREWTNRFGCFAVLSDGPNGLVAGSSEMGVRWYPPFPSPIVVDSTGAGDLFRAGMLHGLSRDWTVDRCLTFAAAAGALACRSIGATSQVPTLGEIALLQQSSPQIMGEYASRW